MPKLHELSSAVLTFALTSGFPGLELEIQELIMGTEVPRAEVLGNPHMPGHSARHTRVGAVRADAQAGLTRQK